MADRRKHLLIDCNPRWSESRFRISFDCPEGHEDCWHNIPFTPSLDGSVGEPQQNGCLWDRTGDTFETLTLSPSIRRVAQYASREAAIADGCLPEYVTEEFLCACHVSLINGRFEFAGDSK
jgi:hypothetical protein